MIKILHSSGLVKRIKLKFFYVSQSLYAVGAWKVNVYVLTQHCLINFDLAPLYKSFSWQANFKEMIDLQNSKFTVIEKQQEYVIAELKLLHNSK